MRLKSLFTLFLVLAVLGFVIVNWPLFAAPAKISFVVGTLEEPFGLVLLVIFAILIAVVMIYVGTWQSAILAENRRQGKEIQLQRSLADNAEASRITALGTMIRIDMSNLEQRLQKSIDSLRDEFRDTESSIAATLGQLDDKIHRVAITPNREIPK